MRTHFSPRPFSQFSFAAIIVCHALGAAAFATAPANIGISVKAGAPRAWQAGLPVTPYSTVSLRHGNVFTVIPITSWSGRGPAINMALYHNSKSPYSVSGLSVAPASGVNLGGGWTHSYGGQLNLVSSTEIWVIADDGTIDKFTKPSSTWVPPAGVHEALTTITGGYRVTHKDQTYRDYDSNGRLTTVGHPDGNTVAIAYATVASYSRISTVTDAAGRVLTFGYNTTTGALTSITAPLTSSTTRQWTFGYTSGAQLETITDPLSHDITVAVDGNSKITSVTDANGNGATIDYDRGTGVLVTDPSPFDDQTVNIEYDTYNDTDDRTVYDRRGNLWQYTFWKDTGALIAVIDPLSHTNAWTFDSDFNRLTFTNPNSKSWTYTYDSMGNQLTITDPLSNVTTMTYHSTFNKLLTRTEPDEITPSRRVTTYTYDSSSGLLLTATDPNSEVTTYTYYGGSDHPQWTGLVKTRTDRVGTITKYEYDSFGHLATQISDYGTSLLNETSTFEYNKAGWRTATVDACSNRTEFTYNDAGLLTQTVVDPGTGTHLAITTAIAYDNGNRRITMTDPRGTDTQYDYDALNRLVMTTAGYGLTYFGFETTYGYDANGNRTSMVDPNYNETDWVYNEANRMTEVVDAESNSTLYEYDPAGNKTKVTDGNGKDTTSTYDDLNRLTSTTIDPGSSPHLNILTQYAYVTGGSGGCGCGGTVGGGTVKRIIDAEGKYTFFEYDLLNRRTSTIRKIGDTSSTADSNDNVTEMTYDDEGRVLTTTILGATSGDDLKTSHTYDALGRQLTTSVDPSGLNLTTTNTYDACGNLETVTGPSGNTITHTYDAARRRTHTEDEIGALESLEYDDGGSITCRSDGESKDTHYSYDAVGRLETMTDPLGKDTDYTYDATGHVWTTTDANNNTKWTLYDGNYRLNYTIDPVGGVVEYTYDGVGNLLTQTAHNGSEDNQVTTYTYDAANRRITETYPDSASSGDIRSFQYNKVGDVTQRTDQNGDYTSYSYDDLHRLTGRSYTVNSSSTYPSSQGPDSFGYDRTGRMISADRDYPTPYADIELDLAYDKANRATSVTESGYAHVYAYTLNTSNDYRDVTYPDGRVIRETNDLRGRVDTIVDRGAGGTGTPVTLADNAYDLNNRQTSRVFANGVTGTWTYDDAGRVQVVAHVLAGSPPTLIAGVTYGRDDVGNPIYRLDDKETTHSEHYWYDEANRLTEFKRGTLNSGKTDIENTDYTSDANLTQRNAWTLDKLGNWDEFVKRTNNTTITEPRTNNKVNEYLTIDPDGSGGSAALNLTHDQNGNVTYDGNWEYDYDIENRCTRVRKGTDVYADYHYDALGRRIRKIIPSGKTDAGTWTYVVNELWQVVSEYKTVSSTTTHQRRYVHAGQSAYVDDHVAMWDVQGSKLYYYHADAQYCTVAMTYTAGSVEERYVTEPYGKSVTYTSAWGSAQSTSRIGNPFMHQGLWLDGECGKYQNRYRDYLPLIGRFSQRDELYTLRNEKMYEANGDSPLLFVDPYGQMAQAAVPPLPAPQDPKCLSDCVAHFVGSIPNCESSDICMASVRSVCGGYCQPGGGGGNPGGGGGGGGGGGSGGSGSTSQPTSQPARVPPNPPLQPPMPCCTCNMPQAAAGVTGGERYYRLGQYVLTLSCKCNPQTCTNPYCTMACCGGKPPRQ